MPRLKTEKKRVGMDFLGLALADELLGVVDALMLALGKHEAVNLGAVRVQG
jgi:hypothetical protein